MKKALSCLLILMFAMAAVAMTPPLSGWTVTIDSTSTGDTVYVTWGTNTVDIINPYHGNGITVTANNGNVTIISTTSTTNIPYVLSGASNAGSLTLTTAKKLKLFLDNLSLTSDTTLPAIYLTEKKDATVTLRGTSTLADNANNAQKGVLQSKGTLVFTGSGTLNVSSYAKHGIASTKESITVQSGTINVLTAASDGIHGVGVNITGGTVNVTNPNGDGIDGDEGAIEISGGEITVNCSANDVKGISCDSTLTISGGTVNVTVSGDQSKGFKTKENMFVTGGEITVTANGSVVLEEIGSGYDPSYCTGVKTSGDFTISNGTMTIVCPSSNAGGHGISTDGDCNVMGGTLHITATGSCVKYTDTTGVYDVYASTCIKSDAGLNIGGGTVTVTAGGRDLSCDGDYAQTGGNVTATTSANGFTTIGSGTSCTDGFAPACLKVDGNAAVTGGLFNGTSTGTGGRGISCDGILTIGVPGGDDDDVFVRVTTSGSPVNGVSSNNSSIDIWKGLPKGIKIDGNIIINSGRMQSYCSQTSGDPNGEALESKDSLFINGGQIEANAFDDAINASNYIEINGGYVWAYARGNDAIDCNGTSMYINGGTVVAMGSECGLDDNSDGGGRLYIKGGNIVVVGSNGSGMGPGMGGTEGTPTMTNQKYITLGSSSGGWPGSGGSSSSISATSGFTIKKDGTPILTFKAPTVSGNGFQNTMPSITGGGTTGAKEGPGQQSSIGTILISSPLIKCSGTYTYFTSPTISGGTNWHGLYSGATVSTSGSGTSTTPKPTSITSSGDTSAVACGSLTWYGTTYTASGTYTHVLHDICGADSTVTLHLTVYNGTHNVETATACESYVWHDTEYFESGTYTYEYTNANGCESVDTLKLTIHYGTHNVITDTAYKFYEWHGETYNESGTYTFDYENNEGCESVDTLHLIVIHCNSITPPYTENFDSYTESTTAATGVEPDCWELVQEDVDMP
ncbi:MAG: carbohydrate-binding domain-containing protein, partial [Bacteroidales bacterium]|nr:carbohydrate-binding domain-containing protein [Bacteroidales bacterium]